MIRVYVSYWMKKLRERGPMEKYQDARDASLLCFGLGYTGGFIEALFLLYIDLSRDRMEPNQILKGMLTFPLSQICIAIAISGFLLGQYFFKKAKRIRPD